MKICFLRTVLSLFLFFCFVHNNVHAQQLEAISYRLAQGLVGEEGLEVLQDSSGFMWINTSNGVSRFDGIEFRNFKEYINHLIMTDDQRILAVTNEGLKQLHYEVDSLYFEMLLPHADKVIPTNLYFPNWIYEDQNQNLWVTERETIALLAKSGRVKKRFKTGTRKLFFVETDTDYMFMFSEQGDIFRYSFLTEKFEKLDFQLQMPDILTAFSPEKNKIWLGGHKIIELNVNQGELEFSQISDNYSASFTCFLKRKNGTLLAGSKDHFIYEIDTIEGFNCLKYGELAENPHYGEGELSSLYEDRDNNIWVTSTIGVALLQEPTFAHLWNLPRAYLGNVAMWIGDKKYVSVDGLFRVEDLENGHKKTVAVPLGEYDGLSSGLTFRDDNQMVVGTSNGHILLLENEQIVKDFDFSERGKAIFHLFADSKGNIWASQRPDKTHKIGVLRISPENEITFYDANQGFTTNPLQIKEKNGNIYVSGIGTKEGLFKYNKGTDSFENIMPELPVEGKNWTHFEVHDFEILENEAFALATTHGFLGIKNGKMRRVLATNPRFKTEIRSILSDPKDGGIWLSTDRYGILKYYDDDHFYKFNEITGVANSMSYRALKIDKNGKLWAGSAESVFYQQKEIKEQKTRKPLFMNIKMGGQKIDFTKDIQTFDYNTSLEASFILPDYPANQVIYEERVYHVKDQEYTPWVSYSGNMRLRLPQFSEGRHVVEIRAKKMGAYEYSDYLSYTFDIQEVWYKTTPVLASGVIGCLLILFLAYKLNEHRHELIEHNLEEAVAERTIQIKEKNKAIERKKQELEKILHDLQDTESLLVQSEKMVALGQIVAGVAHEINTPLGAINASVDNITETQQNFIKNFPAISKMLSVDEQKVFFELVEKTAQSSDNLSTREVRQHRKKLEAVLEENNISNADELADMLVDMGIYEVSETQFQLLKKENIIVILESAYMLALQFKNSANIKQAVRQASMIVRALKSYTHQNHTGDKTETDIIKNIEMILTMYQNLLKQGIEIVKNYESVPLIQAFPDELSQVWTNLIHNAIQAMDGNGKLEISVAQTESWITVHITDSGSGIPAEVQERMFEAFFTTKKIGEGTGLGLSIVRKIMDKHNGKISFESEKGKTTFKIELPI